MERQWKYKHCQYTAIACCWDCGLGYEDPGYIECVLHNHYWEQINPTYDKGCGLLCIVCIERRLSFLGLEDIPVKIFSSIIRVEEKDNV